MDDWNKNLRSVKGFSFPHIAGQSPEFFETVEALSDTRPGTLKRAGRFLDGLRSGDGIERCRQACRSHLVRTCGTRFRNSALDSRQPTMQIPVESLVPSMPCGLAWGLPPLLAGRSENYGGVIIGRSSR